MSPRVARRLFVRWLPHALIVASLVNVMIAVAVQDGGEAIRFHERGSLAYLVRTDSYANDVVGGSPDRNYGFYMELRGVAEGGLLTVPKDSPIDPELVADLSNVHVAERIYDSNNVLPSLIPDTAPLGRLIVGDREVSYWILSGERTVDRWWLGKVQQGFLIVPESLADIPDCDDC